MSQFQDEQQPLEAEPQIEGGEEEAPWQLTQEMYEQQQQALGLVANYIQEQQRAQNGDDPQMPDPYEDPQGFAQWVRAQAEEVAAPLQEYRQQQELGEGEERAMDIIQSLQDAEGEFMVQPDRDNPIGSPQIARMLADEFLEAQEARFGPGSKAAEAALQQGYKAVREWEKRAYEAGYQRQTNQMQTRMSAPMPAPAGPAAAAQTAGVYGNEAEVVRAHTGGFATGR